MSHAAWIENAYREGWFNCRDTMGHSIEADWLASTAKVMAESHMPYLARPAQAVKVAACGAPPLTPEVITDWPGQARSDEEIALEFATRMRQATRGQFVPDAEWMIVHARWLEGMADRAARYAASVEAGPSRGAPAPLAPEGFIDGIGWTYAVRAPDDGMLLAGGVFPTRAEAEAAQGRLRERDYEVGTIVAVALPGRAPAPQAVKVAAGGAPPLAPEWFSVEAVLEERCWDLRVRDSATGADDSDVWWNVVAHHLGSTPERVIGEGSTPRLALAEALGVASVDGGPSRGAAPPPTPERRTAGEG